MENGNGWLLAVRDVLWGPPMLCLMLACGLSVALRTRCLPLRRLGTAVRTVLGGRKRGKTGAQGELTPFQSLTAALAATVGAGNIAGVTAAVWVDLTGLSGLCDVILVYSQGGRYVGLTAERGLDASGESLSLCKRFTSARELKDVSVKVMVLRSGAWQPLLPAAEIYP